MATATVGLQINDLVITRPTKAKGMWQLTKSLCDREPVLVEVCLDQNAAETRGRTIAKFRGVNLFLEDEAKKLVPVQL